PAWSATRIDVNATLKNSTGLAGRASGAGLRHALVVGQVALAFVLIVATALLGRSFYNLQTVDAGFSAGRVLTLTPVLSASGRCATAAGRVQCFRHMVEAVQAVPGVVAAGMI